MFPILFSSNNYLSAERANTIQCISTNPSSCAVSHAVSVTLSPNTSTSPPSLPNPPPLFQPCLKLDPLPLCTCMAKRGCNNLVPAHHVTAAFLVLGVRSHEKGGNIYFSSILCCMNPSASFQTSLGVQSFVTHFIETFKVSEPVFVRTSYDKERRSFSSVDAHTTVEIRIC